MPRTFGLIGYPLSHSFSKGYFTEKFAKENIRDTVYELFPIDTIEKFSELISSQPGLRGLNVTIPYKEAVIPYLSSLDEGAAEIGAVNTIVLSGSTAKGYNTDVYGFEISFRKHLQSHHRNALVLGTGGASKAVIYALKQLGISYQYVSRNREEGKWSYEDITPEVLADYQVIINTTPVGMYPRVEDLPPLPYEALTKDHYLYDLVYNPETTAFLQKGKEKGAVTENGLEMLHLQAEKAWEIWNRPF